MRTDLVEKAVLGQIISRVARVVTIQSGDAVIKHAIVVFVPSLMASPACGGLRVVPLVVTNVPRVRVAQLLSLGVPHIRTKSVSGHVIATVPSNQHCLNGLGQ